MRNSWQTGKVLKRDGRRQESKSYLREVFDSWKVPEKWRKVVGIDDGKSGLVKSKLIADRLAN